MSGLFKAPKPPKIEKPKVMPTADDAALDRAKKKKIAQESSRGGRASTVLTAEKSNQLG